MSDHDDIPENLFDVVCRLDDVAEWLTVEGYPGHAEAIRQVSHGLKGFIVLTLKTPEPKS